MIHPLLVVGLQFWFSAILASTNTVSPSPSATVSSPNPSSSLSNAVTSSIGVQVSSTTPTLAQPLSSTVIVSSKSPFTSTSGSENVHSTVSQSPSITATASREPTGKIASSTVGVGPTTTSIQAKGKTIGALEVIGFCLAAVLGLLVAAFAVYYFAFRKRWYPQYWDMGPESPPPTPAVAAANVSAATTAAAGERKIVPEVGITHAGFTGDASSSTEKVPPVSFNGNAHVEKKEEIPANKQDGEGEENVAFAEDSAL